MKNIKNDFSKYISNIVRADVLKHAESEIENVLPQIKTALNRKLAEIVAGLMSDINFLIPIDRDGLNIELTIRGSRT